MGAPVTPCAFTTSTKPISGHGHPRGVGRITGILETSRGRRRSTVEPLLPPDGERSRERRKRPASPRGRPVGRLCPALAPRPRPRSTEPCGTQTAAGGHMPPRLQVSRRKVSSFTSLFWRQSERLPEGELAAEGGGGIPPSLLCLSLTHPIEGRAVRPRERGPLGARQSGSSCL